MVVGPACSGKSTLARQLGEVLGIPVIELDALFWQPGWASTLDPEFLRRITAATSGEAWIMDGHYERTWAQLWPRTDTVRLDLCPIRRAARALTICDTANVTKRMSVG